MVAVLPEQADEALLEDEGSAEDREYEGIMWDDFVRLAAVVFAIKTQHRNATTKTVFILPEGFSETQKELFH